MARRGGTYDITLDSRTGSTIFTLPFSFWICKCGEHMFQYLWWFRWHPAAMSIDERVAAMVFIPT